MQLATPRRLAALIHASATPQNRTYPTVDANRRTPAITLAAPVPAALTHRRLIARGPHQPYRASTVKERYANPQAIPTTPEAR